MFDLPTAAAGRADPPLHVTVRGLADANAQVRRTVHGQVWLSVTLSQPGVDTRIFAAQHVGDTDAHDLAAHAKARLLKRGAGVTVTGRRVCIDRIEGQWCLRVEGAEIVAHDVPVPFHERVSEQERAS